MNQNEKYDEVEVELINNGIFLKYLSDLPKVLEIFFSKNEFKNIIEKVNHLYKLQGYVFIFAITIIFFPISIYYLIKSINYSVHLIYEINNELKLKNLNVCFLIIQRLMSERKFGKPKHKVIFLFPKDIPV
ncbi:hypothetical protein ACTFIY_009987 [Dictyostelium cf. discoideum]